MLQDLELLRRQFARPIQQPILRDFKFNALDAFLDFLRGRPVLQFGAAELLTPASLLILLHKLVIDSSKSRSPLQDNERTQHGDSHIDRKAFDVSSDWAIIQVLVHFQQTLNG